MSRPVMGTLHRRSTPWSAARRCSRLLAISWFLLACSGQPADGQQVMTNAETALRSGKYDEAIRLYRSAAAGAQVSPHATRGLVRALSMVGHYEEAEEVARRAIAASAGSAELSNTLGEVLVQRGRLAAADSAFAAAVAGRASDSLTARLNLATLRFDRGEREAAMREFDHFIDVYNRGQRLTAEELMAVAVACRYLGLERHEMFQDALKAYDRAIAAAPEALEPRVRVGELFLEKYNGADARASFAEVLEVNPTHPGALVGMARVLVFEGQPGSEQAHKAIEVNPGHVGAHVLLGSMALGNGDPEEATRSAQVALEVNPASVEALALMGAARYLARDRAGFEDARRRALALRPRSAEFHATLAEMVAQSRLYREAMEFAREGVALDSMSWSALGVLGMNQLRLGDIEAGRRSLERAFERDPYDLWVKNTLDLLDTFAGYEEVRTPRFLFMAEQKEAELMGLYAGELAEEAFTKLQGRYGYEPSGPIRVELYRSHADFSVRTVGMTGLGALGVAFGDVLALDSPSARELGRFNWGSVLWHELAHTFTLGATANRVPRWFSEGLSVLEERRARPGWGDDVTPSFLIAYRDERLPPVSTLNQAFTRPAYPEQIGHAYYMASLVCEMIEEQGGIQAIRDMLRGYREGQGTSQVFERVLGTDAEGFDRRFDAWLRERYAGPMDALGAARGGIASRLGIGRGGGRGSGGGEQGADVVQVGGEYADAMREGIRLAEADRHEQAIAAFERAKALFPQYAGEDSPYGFLARIYKERGDDRRAAAELSALTAIDGANYTALLELATLLEKLGDTAGATSALDRALYVNPFERSVHERLATLYAQTGDRAKVVRERRAILALDPVDRSAALYQLALAYWEAGDRDAARREVLRALEIAPNFDEAQRLLLTIRRGGSAGAGEDR